MRFEADRRAVRLGTFGYVGIVTTGIEYISLPPENPPIGVRSMGMHSARHRPSICGH